MKINSIKAKGAVCYKRYGHFYHMYKDLREKLGLTAIEAMNYINTFKIERKISKK